PATRSPFRNPVTSSPTFSTIPATSSPEFNDLLLYRTDFQSAKTSQCEDHTTLTNQIPLGLTPLHITFMRSSAFSRVGTGECTISTSSEGCTIASSIVPSGSE